ncbi:MAG: sensor histidine kinase [Gemmatimonas sp.]
MPTVDARFAVAQATIDALRKCTLILDDRFRVILTNRAFSAAFNTPAKPALNETIVRVGGEWESSGLKARLFEALTKNSDIHDREFEIDLSSVGRRTLVVNASPLTYPDDHGKHILLQIEDVTDCRILEGEKNTLLRQKDILIEEMSHRISNSLQIIASILMLKARTVTSSEARHQLEDAHRRVLAVANVQGHLRPGGAADEISASFYLTGLCESLSNSLLNDDRAISISVEADEGTFTPNEAVSLGLITTELVINAIKHAFPDRTSGAIVVRYESGTTARRLSVSDNGRGFPTISSDTPLRVGLGTSILEALTRQLGGHLVTSANSPGTMVSVTIPRR